MPVADGAGAGGTKKDGVGTGAEGAPLGADAGGPLQRPERGVPPSPEVVAKGAGGAVVEGARCDTGAVVAVCDTGAAGPSVGGIPDGAVAVDVIVGSETGAPVVAVVPLGAMADPGRDGGASRAV